MYRPYGNSVPSTPFQDVESTIRGLTQDYCTAFNTGNYDQVSALFGADGLYMPPNHEPVQGPRAVELLLRQYSEQGYQDLRLETIRVDYAGDLAVEVGRYTVAIRQLDGTTVADRGKFVHGWRRLGSWFLVADSWNSNLPTAR
jgi:ketosteroid isomerase-like protein